jgi:hypothetical protein
MIQLVFRKWEAVEFEAFLSGFLGQQGSGWLSAGTAPTDRFS